MHISQEMLIIGTSFQTNHIWVTPLEMSMPINKSVRKLVPVTGKLFPGRVPITVYLTLGKILNPSRMLPLPIMPVRLPMLPI